MGLFNEASDYEAFLKLFAKAQDRVPVRCLAYCIMPNHFHFVLWPLADGDLSRFMFWLTTTHSVRWNAWHGQTGTGHVYQGRFKAFPIYQDGHLFNVCRYVERNPLRAGLVDRAEAWRWSSLAQVCGRTGPVTLSEWPVPRPADWPSLVQSGLESDIAEIRNSVARNAPYGPNDWCLQVATQLGLQSALRREGRPGNRTTPMDSSGKNLPNG